MCANVVFGSSSVDVFCVLCVTAYLRDCKYDPVFLLCVFAGGAIWSDLPPACLSELFAANTTLVPEVWDKELSLDDLAHMAKKKCPWKGPEPQSPTDGEIDALLDCPNDDKLAQELFPPRTKTDMGIRNIRMADALTYCAVTGRSDAARRVLKLCKGFDYITTQNLLTALFCFNEDWWRTLSNAGVFDGDSEHYRLSCKVLSDLVKKTKNCLPSDERVCYYECAALFGAMCPPVAGWDPVQETKELASGGQTEHGLLFGEEFGPGSILKRIKELARFEGEKPSDGRGFEDWLRSCEWERSGASSVGRVEYEVEADGEQRKGSFKARKNLVLDVVPFQQIVDSTRSHASQDNKALIKSEFGKVRLAVSAPLEVYLQQGFLYAVSGSAYLRWPGNTLEEAVADEMQRNERTLLAMSRGHFALPYDFARFDHQPTTDEVVAFQSITFDRALTQARPFQRDDVILFEDLLEQGFRSATLTTPPGVCAPQTFPVTGGLMSGLRSTSAVGSGWNSVLGESARDIASRFRSRGRPVDTWQIVRGDDTQVISPNYLDVLAVKIGYDVLGAEANESKFTLRRGRTEFLRVEIEDRARCYPCRTVPLVGQSKPWSARAPTADASLTRLDKVFSVLARRLPDPRDLLAFADHVLSRMVSMMRLDVRLISIPTALGGLGLRPWGGKWHVSVWAGRLPIPVKVLNQTTFRTDQQYEKYRSIGVNLSGVEARTLADRELREKIATDDMIEIAGTVRRVRRAELARRKIVSSGTAGAPPPRVLCYYSRLMMFATNLDVTEGAYRRLEMEVTLACEQAAPLYGCEDKATERITAISNLAAVRRISLGTMLRMHAPWFYNKLLRVERQYKLRRSVAVDFLLGALNVPRSDCMPSCVPRLAHRVGAVFLAEMSRQGQASSFLESYRWFEVGASRFVSALMESAYGQKLLLI